MNDMWVDNIIQRLLEGARYPTVLVQPSDIIGLCQAAAEVFLSELRLLEIHPPIVICGDIWGQYGDLLRLFHRVGFPPKSNYLFLGNYTFNNTFDTLCLLLAYKIKYPNNIFLLRGEYNEDERMRCLCDSYYYYTFVCGSMPMEHLHKCFSSMPVAAIIGKKIFCVHGGLSPQLHELEMINRIQISATTSQVGSLLHDLLNSKPDSTIQGWKNTAGGITFGPDVVSEFLKKFKLDLICRGHEIVDAGCKFFADRQLVTIFSAPNLGFRGNPTLLKKYQGVQCFSQNLKNMGVVMVIDDQFKCTFLFLQSNGSKFKFEVQQARDGRIPDRTLVHIHELPKVKTTEILPFHKIGRKEKFEAAFKIDELEAAKLEYHFNKTYDLTLNEYMEKNLELDILAHEKDDALEEAEAPGLNTQQLTNKTLETFGSNIFHSELKKATKNFDISMKIGEGGFAIVYKGFLRGTTVAIKTLRPERLIEQSGFVQEAEILSRVRHPNLVTLIGFCSQPFSLVYEYLSKGSLEDRLSCKNGSPPLPWQVRTRVIAEIRSALIFLHSNKPHPIVHGDLKPDNIFLDANMVSKLGDFGICSFLDNKSTTESFYHLTDHPKGTLGYIDPEYLTSGRLTTQSDVFSFGVIILRLVSGRPARGIIEEARKAINKWRMSAVTDPLAGDWPAAQAKELIKLGVRCCHHERKKRPQLAGKEWRFVEASLSSVS